MNPVGAWTIIWVALLRMIVNICPKSEDVTAGKITVWTVPPTKNTLRFVYNREYDVELAVIIVKDGVAKFNGTPPIL